MSEQDRTKRGQSAGHLVPLSRDKVTGTLSPLLDALDAFIQNQYAYFAIPGHRYERGLPSALTERFGFSVYRYDLTEAPGLDDFHSAQGPIKEAQQLAASLFGADACRFSVNGTTALVEAMILSVCSPGDEIILARDVHRCAVSGLVLSGARPVWIYPEMDENWGISNGIRPESVQKTITEHPFAKAVLIVSPTYYGQCSDLTAIAKICHEHGIPLLVDAAHGSHFPFSDAFPADALSSGADIVAMSLHKTTGSMTQSSMLFYKNSACTSSSLLHRLDESLHMTISSSPSYVLMASLDAARHQLYEHGQEMAADAVQKALTLRRSLESIPGVNVRGGSDLSELLQKNRDVTRVVFSIDGITGTELKKLLERDSVVIEMADGMNAVAVVTASNTMQEIEMLRASVKKAAEKQITPDRKENRKNRETVSSEYKTKQRTSSITPRKAFFAAAEEITLTEAVGRTCVGIICAYPPGIPALVPGEQILQEDVCRLQEMIRLGIPVQGIRDGTFIRVTGQRKREV